MHVRDPAKRPQRLARHAVLHGVGAQPQLLPIAPVQLKPALRPVRDRLRQPVTLHAVPLDLQAHKALADGVGHVKQHVLKVRHLLQQFVQLRGGLQLGAARRLLRRHHLPLQQAGAAALVQLAGNVAVLLLHVLEQLELRCHIAGLGRVEDARQLARRQPARRVRLQLALQRRQVRRLRRLHVGHLHGLPVGPEDA